MTSRRKTPVDLGRRSALALLFFCCIDFSFALASHHYTEQQLDALASRIGKVYWIHAANGPSPLFLSSAADNAPSFRMEANASFEIIAMAGRKARNPYYKVKFDSGKEGYIRPEVFLDELNLTIVSVDPRADEKRKQAAAAEEDEKRMAWIQAQPWSEAVKQAAIKRRAVAGMRTDEIKKVMGQPARISKVRRPKAAVEERWLYADGSVLVFHNGLLTRVEPNAKSKP